MIFKKEYNQGVIHAKGYQALPEERCGNCKYFRKHYLRSGRGRYFATGYGHCVHPRLKKRRSEERCQYWEAVDAKDPRSS